MFVEQELTTRIGDEGKMLHTARSRNDQVAVDLRLYLREQAAGLVQQLKELELTLCARAEEQASTVMFGSDANWGRVLCAIGYADAPCDVHKVAVSFASKAGAVEVCRDGAGIPFSEEEAKRVLSEKEIDVIITLGDGQGSATAYGCDLTYDYVKINGDYRT